MTTLTIFYDARCGLCSRVRGWMTHQPAYLRIRFMPYDSPDASRLLPAIKHLHADREIVVMADTGEVWQGASAWVICLWALRDYRAWSARFANPAMQALARPAIQWISNNRNKLSRLLHLRSDSEIQSLLSSSPDTSTTCALPTRPRHDLDLID